MPDVKYARSPEELASARQPKGLCSLGRKGDAGYRPIARRALLGAGAGVAVLMMVLLVNSPQRHSGDSLGAGAFFFGAGLFAYLGALVAVVSSQFRTKQNLKGSFDFYDDQIGQTEVDWAEVTHSHGGPHFWNDLDFQFLHRQPLS